ncbi:hypothetical protein DL93DRAFT_1598117 [Clavulina sp. PMI_390]|nr:hypothetical protein DL93DRAFT_1598117 [Clavulina sp. PMI_390]
MGFATNSSMEYKPRVAPGRTLPHEILSEIFSFAVGDPMYRQHNSGLALSHVCQQWRRAALQTSELWSHVALSSLRQTELLSLFGSRSGRRRSQLRFLASCRQTQWHDDELRIFILSEDIAPQISDLIFDDPLVMAAVFVPEVSIPLLSLNSVTINHLSPAPVMPPKRLLLTQRLIVNRMTSALYFNKASRVNIAELCGKQSALSAVSGLARTLNSHLTTLELYEVQSNNIDPVVLSQLTRLSLTHCEPSEWGSLSRAFLCPSLRSLSITICDMRSRSQVTTLKIIKNSLTQLVRIFFLQLHKCLLRLLILFLV